ncbi:MAG: class I SAM-dependent methyltransferase [Spirochaetaceae bacterium]|jgi:SAM-dependent methyltransferase|nr:class I SAM-dependent methyltransferase [Spirochaetaceae bacterium]
MIKSFYNEEYFNWQKSIGKFGGWANQTKFVEYITDEDVVLGFGCGGGFLLKNLRGKKKIEVEINHSAAETARQNGIEVYNQVDDVSDDSVDVIISNNALEHTHYPLGELRNLYKKLKKGGIIVL